MIKTGIIAVLISLLALGSYVYFNKYHEEYCVVLNDTRSLEAPTIFQLFNVEKIAYFYDYQNSYRVLVAKSQLTQSRNTLKDIGINATTNTTCQSRFKQITLLD